MEIKAKVSPKIYAIMKDGKELHKYQIYRSGILEGWLIGESPEKLCEQHHWRLEEYEFIQTSFSMWDVGDATPVRKP